MAESRSATAFPSTLYRWMVIGLLMAMYACAFIDRQIINLLAPAIQKDFALTDVETGLLLGPAFAIIFVLAGVFFGRIADRANRSRMIRWGLAAWSICTAASGLAPTFVWLFSLRIGVGVGEATIAPAGVSLIGDITPPAQRAKSLATFNMGANLGAGLSNLLGAALIPAAPVLLPLMGLLQPWQATFIYIGVPGLLIAMLGLAVREPVRREKMATSPDVVRGFVRARLGLFLPFFGGATMLICLGYGAAAWAPTYFSRTFGWPTSQIGVVLGVQTLIGAVAATVIASWLVGWSHRRGHLDATLRAMMVGAALIIIPSIFAWQMPNAWAAVVVYGIEFFAMAFTLNLVGTAICDVAPNEWRASLYALYLMVSSLCGLGFGPPLIGFFAQYLFHGDVGNALTLFGVLFAPGGILLLWWSAPAFRAAAAEARDWR